MADTNRLYVMYDCAYPIGDCHDPTHDHAPGRAIVMKPDYGPFTLSPDLVKYIKNLRAEMLEACGAGAEPLGDSSIEDSDVEPEEVASERARCARIARE